MPMPGSGYIESPIFSSVSPQWEREPFVTTFHPSVLADAAAARLGLDSPDLTGIDIVLQRSRRFLLSGTVVDSQGHPAVVTSVVLSRTGLGTIGNLPFRTTPQGRFELRSVEPGEYRLQIGSGFAPSPASVNGRTEFGGRADHGQCGFDRHGRDDPARHRLGGPHRVRGRHALHSA